MQRDYNSFEEDPEGPAAAPDLARMVSYENARVMQDAFLRMGRSPSIEIGEMGQTYYCHICLSNKRLAQGYKLRACGHYFCRSCLSDWLESQFQSKQIHPSCFYVEEKGACNTEVMADDLKNLSTERAWEKYTYFSNKEANPNFIDCPKCKLQQLGDPRKPWTKCKSQTCDHEFCYIHMNQHPKTMSCADYEAQVRIEEKKNRAWRSQHTKNCPKCGVATEKNEGCNHMTCYVCKTGWCWLCGEIIGNQTLPDHYKEGECKGKQFTSESAAYLTQWEALCCIMLPALFFLLFSPIAFLMAIVVFIISPILYLCCCCPDAERNRTAHQCVNLLVHIIIFAPILIITLPFWFPCFIYYNCVIAPRRHQQRQDLEAAAEEPLLGSENA